MHSRYVNRQKLNRSNKSNKEKHNKNDVERTTIDTFHSSVQNSPRSIKYQDDQKFLNVTYPKFNDHLEVIRMERHNMVYKEMWQGNFSAPVTEMLEMGGHVLDLG